MLDLEKANAAGPDVTPEWEIEYTTYAREDLSRYLRGEKREGETLPIPWMNATEGGEMVRRMGWEELAPYEMKDLTIGRWLDLAYRLGKGAKLWKGFRKRLFVSTDV